ncbi:MAG: MFS transporter [Anaerolineae bacterium]
MAETVPTALTAQPDPPYYRRNARAFAAETTFLVIGMSLMSSTSVVPSLIQHLTGSTVLVGIVTGLGTAAWLLPQLLVAGAVAGMSRRKPFMMRMCWIGRNVHVPVAIVIGLLGSSQPLFTLIVLTLGTMAFSAFDGLRTVPFYDLFAQCIPPRRRGRVMGIALILGGVASIGAGEVVRFMLGERSPWDYPTNYAALFAVASLFYVLSAYSLSHIEEFAPPAKTQEVLTLRRILATLPEIVFGDRPFLRANLVRLFSGFVNLASAFYVLNAVNNLGLPLEVAGLFVAAQVTGALLAGMLTAVVHDRWGPLVHLRLVTGASALPPLIALIAQPFADVLGPAMLYPYLAVFLCLGLYLGSYNQPYFNWILEYVGQERLPLYIGIGNTLGALLMLAPPLGGWLVARFSYPTAFAAALLCVCVAVAISFTLPSTRRGQSTTL